MIFVEREKLLISLFNQIYSLLILIFNTISVHNVNWNSISPCSCLRKWKDEKQFRNWVNVIRTQPSLRQCEPILEVPGGCGAIIMELESRKYNKKKNDGAAEIIASRQQNFYYLLWTDPASHRAHSPLYIHRKVINFFLFHLFPDFNDRANSHEFNFVRHSSQERGIHYISHYSAEWNPSKHQTMQQHSFQLLNFYHLQNI